MSAISWAWKAEQSPPLEYTRNFAPDKQFLMVLIFFNVLAKHCTDNDNHTLE